MTEKFVFIAYIDYQNFDEYSENDKCFISIPKNNAVIDEFKKLYITYYDSEHRLLDKNTRTRYYKDAYLGNKYNYKTKKEYRIIKILDSKNRGITFITNIFKLSTEEISLLYKKILENKTLFQMDKTKS
ncbi:hypothetical protein FDC22_05775 [Clostridium botulinum]|uniref:hypothetical protein n=1 Tax=Clostridium botulinum TaxID=1491 RepID=UPI0001D194A6|nr:hypothetical protein [Clostridium botulinum]EKX78699.1 hypothetical protein CFSAN001628_017679 [Clostridium botulinum CFSAN001628]ADG00498.1 hypothetical protein CBF_2880 [Clostridium botulinum F str. 230613]KKM41004.1 hypothetical protein VT72_13075 [Clostridium botulinum]MBD5564781.1 hypothetical protein [Clostridium botulinum]MBD5567262.1 hypothetical protein [Clostridium botulinum]